MTVEQVETEALKLDPEARAKLAEKLLRSLDDLSEEDIEQLWAEEAFAATPKSILERCLREMLRTSFVMLDPGLREKEVRLPISTARTTGAVC